MSRVLRHWQPPAPGPVATRDCSGFTLVELVLVLVIIGILAAVAAPRFSGTGVYAERGYYDELASALRYAQKVAVASGCPVRANVTAAGFTLGQQVVAGGHCNSADGTFATPVRLPGGQVLNGTAPAGVAVAPVVTIIFDAQGRTDLAGDQAIAVGARTLTIQAESGLVLTP